MLMSLRSVVLSSVIAVFSGFIGVAASAAESVRVGDLRCEYRIDPLGIDVVEPRLSWRIQSSDAAARGLRQSAYQVLVASSAADLKADRGDLWDSRRVGSDQSTLVLYRGKPLTSRTQCHWKVRVWDADGRASAWSEPGKWSMGLLEPSDWKSQWIGVVAKAGQTKTDPWFRKTFSLPDRPVRATAYVASIGYHELYINGKKVDDRVLAPSISDLTRRVRYVTYDVTDFLQPGANAVVLWCAPGWADFDDFKVKDKPLVTAQIEVLQSNGQSTMLVTDSTWKTRPSPLSPIGGWGLNDYGGERYDAGLETPGWNTVQLDDSAWAPVAIFKPDVQLSAEMIEPNRRLETLKPLEIKPQGPGVFRVDMGRNFAGWFEIRMKGRPGQKVTLEFSERPELAKCFEQVSEYVFGKSGEGVFSHRFNHASFRWVTLSGLDAAPRDDDVRGYLVSIDSPRIARFECSSEYLNRLYETTLWTYRSISAEGYIVDCPHRERLGYGDAGQQAMETALTSFATGAFFTKWLGDWRDVQLPDGDVIDTAPNRVRCGGPAWGGICVSLPWQMYLRCGDRRVLEQCYPMMRRWIAFLDTKTKDHLLQKWGGRWDFLGDWVPPGKGQGPEARVDERSTAFFNDCYYLGNVTTIATIADLLGKPEEAAEYRKQAAAIAQAAHREFFHPEKNTYANGDQTYEAFPLLVGLTPASLQPAVMNSLEREIVVNKKGHLDTGILGTYFMIKLLVERNRNDLLFQMVNQRTYPGWGYMLENGATTIWEQWDGKNSLVHGSFISIGSWFIEGIAGIRPDPAQPGYKHFVVRPGIVGDLTWARGECESPYGKIVSEWRVSKDGLTMAVDVPVNSTATVFVPANDPSKVTESGRPAGQSPGVRLAKQADKMAVYEIGSGRYTFSVAKSAP
jgi:alpha-L-rhamnosidase